MSKIITSIENKIWELAIWIVWEIGEIIGKNIYKLKLKISQRRDRHRFMKSVKKCSKSKQLIKPLYDLISAGVPVNDAIKILDLATKATEIVIIEPSIMLTPEGRRLIRTGEYFQYESINERSEK